MKYRVTYSAVKTQIERTGRGITDSRHVFHKEEGVFIDAGSEQEAIATATKDLPEGCEIAVQVSQADASMTQETDASSVDWNSEEGKQATARLNSFVEHMGKSAPEGSKKVAIPLGTDENGQPFGIITWSKS